MTAQIVLNMARAICREYCDDCMQDSKMAHTECTARNCMIVPIAARIIRELPANGPRIPEVSP